jgi:hypothetical protein
MFSCKTTDQATSDKNEFGSGGDTLLGVYSGLENKLIDCPYIFIGEFTGILLRNDDGHYYKEFHVSERIRGDVDDYIRVYNSLVYGLEDYSSDYPFKTGEKYLLLTDKINNIYSGEVYLQGVLFCPIDNYEDAFMNVLGERKNLDFMTTGSAENFKDYDSFKAYLLSLIETTEVKGIDWPYYIDSDDIYDILTVAPQIFKVKIIGHGSKEELYSDYLCRMEKVYKGDYDSERGNLIRYGFSGNIEIQRPINQRKHYFSFRLFDADIDLEKTDEYIICANSTYLIARKGVISLEYTEEEIIQMLEEIYGEVDILEIPEENAVLQ